MTRTQIQQTVVILLLVAFGGAWLLTRQISPMQPSLAPSPKTTGVMKVEPSPDLEPEELLPESSAQPMQLPRIQRDPFQLPPLLAKKILEKETVRERSYDAKRSPSAPSHFGEQVHVQLPDLTLQGIFWGSAQPQVLINRKILSVGDEIEGSKIVAVTKQGITVSYQGQKFNLKLPQHDDGEDRS